MKKAIEIINRNLNNGTSAVIETVYPFATADEAREYAINLCNTEYADNPGVVYRIVEA